MEKEISFKKEEHFIDGLIDAIEDVFYVFDDQGNFIKWNKAFEKVNGYSYDEVSGMKPVDFFTKEGAVNITNAVQEAFEKGSAAVEEEFLTKDGRLIPMFFSGSVIKDLSRQPILCGTGKNITELKEKEDALRAREARYRIYLEVTGQIGWTTPPNGIVEDMPEWRKYTGQSKEEVKGWGWLNAIHSDDRERTIEVWERAVEKKSTYETEYRIRRRDGVYRYFLARGIPSLREDGTIREWVGACIDITERKNAEIELEKYRNKLEELVREKTEDLRKSEEQLRLASESANIGMWVWNVKTGELVWTDICKKLFGLPIDKKMSYEVFLEALQPDDRRPTDEAVKKSLNENKEYNVEYRALWADGSTHWLNAVGRPYYDAAGNVESLVGIVIDIDAVKKQRIELQAKIDELERFRQATVEREFRMKELRDEIEKLKK